MSERGLRPRSARPQEPAPSRRRRRQQAPAAAADPADPADHAVDSGEDGDEDNVTELPQDQTPREGTDLAARKEEALLAHFRNLPRDVQGAVILTTKQLKDEAQRARQLLKDIPIPTEAEALSYIAPNPVGWTEEDEAALLQQWDDTPERQALTAEVKGTHPMWTLWKTWLRLLHTAPSCFISAQNGLQFERKLKDGFTPDPNWSKDFCNRLRKLACHGIFQERIELLHLALLWVPICRQDYRGPIRWQNPTSDALLTKLVRRMRHADGSKSVKDLHDEVRAEYGPRGPGSVMSDLLQGIEKRAFEPADEPPAHHESMPVFDLSAADLRVVKRAANAVKAFGLSAFYPMAVSWRLVATSLAAGSKEDYPTKQAQLERLRNAAALSVQRYLTRPSADDADQSDLELGRNLVHVPAPVDGDDNPFDDMGDGPVVADAATFVAPVPASIPAGRPRQIGLHRAEAAVTALPLLNGNKVAIRLQDQDEPVRKDIQPGGNLLSRAITSNGLMQPRASAGLQTKHETLWMESQRLP